MNNYVFRLTKSQDLKKEIESFVKEKNIEAGIIKCAVGCVYEVNFRLAEAKEVFHKKANYEIVSIMGTVSVNGCHIHASFADNKGNVIGGHLKDGCLVDTAAEICIESFNNYVFDRRFDEKTGYKELIVNKSGEKHGL